MLRLGAAHRSRPKEKTRRKRKGAPAKAKSSAGPLWKTGNFPPYLIVPADELPKEERAQSIIIMIPAPDDPEDTAGKRRERGEAQAARGQLNWRDLNRRGIVSWKEGIWGLLEDGEARTFHRMMVELVDRRGSFCGGHTPEYALWDLVYAKVVEFRNKTPIYFRRSDHKSEDGEVLELEDPRIQLVGVPDMPRR